MYKCDYCDKEYKMIHHLNKHMDSCKAKTVEDEVIVEETIYEPSDVSTELQRRIDKLKVTIRQSYDAEVRFRLECELKDLVSKL